MLFPFSLYFSKQKSISDYNCLGILQSVIGNGCINQLFFDYNRSSAHHYYLTFSRFWPSQVWMQQHNSQRSRTPWPSFSLRYLERTINGEDFKIYVNIVMSSQSIVTHDFAPSVLHSVRMHEETIKLLSKKIARPSMFAVQAKNLWSDL